MYLIRLFPDAMGRHLSQIYAGLYELAAMNQIRLEFTRRCDPAIRKYRKNNLWLEVMDLSDHKTRKVCFDMGDFEKINSPDGLKKADIYFKRSYHRTVADQLDAGLKQKVFPYGLYYPCRSRRETGTAQVLFLHHLIHNHFVRTPFQTLKNIIGSPVRLLISEYLPGISDPGLHMTIEDFEVRPDEAAEQKVLFQTCVWSPEETPGSDPAELKRMNNMRADTVRALKKHFGPRFVGGMKPTPFAEKYYGDCLASRRTDRMNYIGLVRRCLIAVTTSGLYKSNGAKLPEYLAASRCVVSEPLHYELPVRLTEGKHYLSFKTPDECVRACEKILDHPELARQMRHANYEYYAREVRPSALMLKCIKTALNN